MSRCTRTAQLDALVQGELSAVEAGEVRAHADACLLCRHELRWLEAEAQLFRQRAGREEVEHLWKDVAARSGLAASPRPLWALASLAAALLVVVGLSRFSPTSRIDGRASSAPEQSEEALMSQPLESSDLCSRLPEGLGFHCGPATPASFFASR